jgi:uncharacterized protein
MCFTCIAWILSFGRNQQSRGHLAHHCETSIAARIQSLEKYADVLWLRAQPMPEEDSHNGRLQLTHADVSQAIMQIPDASVGALLHDPPRFGIVGELYSQVFYGQLSRMLHRSSSLFQYTGSPNASTSGRDVPREVARRLEKAGFKAERALDGVLGVRR